LFWLNNNVVDNPSIYDDRIGNNIFIIFIYFSYFEVKIGYYSNMM
jgi:hypothetical protein